MSNSKILIPLLFVSLLGGNAVAAPVVRFEWEGMITTVNASQAASSNLPASIQVGDTVRGTIDFDPNRIGLPFGSFTRYQFPTSVFSVSFDGQPIFFGTGARMSVDDNSPIGLDSLSIFASNGLSTGLSNGDWSVTAAVRDFDELIFDDESLVTEFTQQTFDNEIEFQQLSISRFWNGVVYSNPIELQYTAFSIAMVPEPSSFALLGMLSAGVAMRRRRSIVK